MVDVRQWLAVGLGVLLGVFLLVAPRAALKLSVLSGTGQRRRRGEYGSDAPVSEWWVWATRGLGVVCLGVAAVIAL
ncbi:hypothetical protein [Haloarcula salinisoli]|uniref:DUF6199 domain-containing protein n=1 Tax=Haloarcula salinisoli TaxID=2487746 RepID=A0A8J7YM54_9EURY|nr:hypothetical protein [Halomicroarcula salinisoli]MBX0288355.1 hypothetical protein [Halomicroarcula salinisoli]MBX0305836.1 hypothetical protein [Halomicroarcula salinisoli]